VAFITYDWVRKHLANVLTAYHVMRAERQLWLDDTAAGYAARGMTPPAWLLQGEVVGVREGADGDDGDGVGDGDGDGEGEGDGDNASDSDDEDDNDDDDDADVRREWRNARALERVKNPRMFSLVPMHDFRQ